MLAGLPPFYDGMPPSFVYLHTLIISIATENTDAMYQKILQQSLVFGDEIGSSARSILTGLLPRDPHHRLGVKGSPADDSDDEGDIPPAVFSRSPRRPTVARTTTGRSVSYSAVESELFSRDLFSYFDDDDDSSDSSFESSSANEDTFF